MQSEAIASMHTAFSGVDGEGLPMVDGTFLRYLRARNFDVPLATAMLRSTITWRREFDIKSMRRDGWAKVIEEENKTGKSYCRGFSKFGHVLLYLRPKHENTYNYDGNIKHLVYNMERAVACMEADGRGESLALASCRLSPSRGHPTLTRTHYSKPWLHRSLYLRRLFRGQARAHYTHTLC